MKLEDKLLSLRKQQGLTQLELAQALHISRQAISKWETGEATPSLENLKSLSQLYQVPLGQLLGEDQPPVQPPQAEPKEETDGDPPAAELAGEEVPPGEISKPSSKRRRVLTAVLLGWAAVLSIGIVAGYLWWNSQPAQQFLYWNEGEASSSPISPGISLDVSVTRFSDGSGSIAYTLQNNTSDTFYFSKWVWIDYKYQGKYHCISLEPGYTRYIPASLRGDATFFVDPGETWSDTVSLRSKTLALPGQYRFCVENIGFVKFAVFEDGDVLVGKSLNG